MAGRKGGLGKGLEALFTDNATGDVNSATRLERFAACAFAHFPAAAQRD